MKNVVALALHGLSFVARWLGALLVAYGFIQLMSTDRLYQSLPPSQSSMLFAAVGALAALISFWFSRRKPISRIVLGVVALAGIALAAYQHWDRTHAFCELAVTFNSGDVRLAGTLYLPNRYGPAPGMVFVAGGTPTPRFVYRSGAEHFAREGYAVLIYDKRGTGASGGVYPGISANCGGCIEQIELFSDDAAAAFRYLATRPELDRDRIGFYGVSQAGWIVPRAARMSGDVGFVLLLSAPTVPSHVVMRYQTFTGGADPGVSADAAEARAQSVALSNPPPNFDPLPDLRALDAPGLWLYGGRDWNVAPGSSITVLDALIAEGKPFEHRLVAGGGHGFIYDPPDFYWPLIDAWLARVAPAD